MEELGLLQKISIWVIPVLFAITLHEVAHGWVASLLGDQTARQLDRLSLNPLRHIDPIGTILIPIVTGMLAGFIFGYARPVPVIAENLRRPKTDMAKVAIAGPMANLIMAVFWLSLLKLLLMFTDDLSGAVLFVFLASLIGIYINLILMVLNLLPMLPLDGGRIVAAILPAPLAAVFMRIEPFGFLILVMLLAMGVLGRVLLPMVEYLYDHMTALAGVNINILQLLQIVT